MRSEISCWCNWVLSWWRFCVSLLTSGGSVSSFLGMFTIISLLRWCLLGGEVGRCHKIHWCHGRNWSSLAEWTAGTISFPTPRWDSTSAFVMELFFSFVFENGAIYSAVVWMFTFSRSVIFSMTFFGHLMNYHLFRQGFVCKICFRISNIDTT